MTPRPALKNLVGLERLSGDDYSPCLIYLAPQHLDMASALEALPDMPNAPHESWSFGHIEQERCEDGGRAIQIGAIVVAVLGIDPQQVIGMVNLSGHFAIDRQRSKIFICIEFAGICVAENYRGQDIGCQMASSAGESMANLARVFLDTFPTAAGSIHLCADFNSKGGETTYYVMSEALRQLEDDYPIEYVESCGY